MPCTDPRLDADGEQLYRACNLLNLFAERFGFELLPRWITRRDYVYPMQDQAARLNAATEALCAVCLEQGDAFIYNGRDPDCRKLADWWDDHKRSPGHEHPAETAA